MEGFVIVAKNDDGSLKGYYNGAGFNTTDLNEASFIQDKTQARSAVGNLQRVEANLEISSIAVTKTITLSNAVGV